tara:strand:+ start:3585 stop:4106 length:522 start_codon:yes stop_codon:yes gene_type:complete
MNVKEEVGKIDVDTLRRLEWERGKSWDCIGIYLAEPGRLTEDNAMMAMGHAGGGVFLVVSEPSDSHYEGDLPFFKRTSSKEGLEFLKLDYDGLDGVYHDQTEGSTNGIATPVLNAIVAYAMVSNYAKANNMKFNPFVPAEKASPEFRSRLPQQLLNLDQPDEKVREDLVAYLG